MTLIGILAFFVNVSLASNGAKVLHLYSYSDYFPETLIKGFEQSCHCKVQYDNFANNEELLAKMQAGAKGYDVIVPSDYTVQALTAGKLLSPINALELSNLKNLSKDFVNLPYDPGNKFSVPYAWGTTGLVINTKHVKSKNATWSLLFDEAYKGKISLLDDEREVIGALLRSQGFSVNTTDPDQLKNARKLLFDVKSRVRVFSSDPKQILLSGDVWIAHIYNCDAQRIIDKHPEYQYVMPAEGGIRWIDTLAIPKTAQNSELAHQFINYVLDQKNGSLMAQVVRAGSPNAASEKAIKDENLRPGYLKKINGDKFEFLKDLGRNNFLFDDIWTAAKTR